MIRCQICNAEISDEEIREGRCPECMGLMTWAGQSFEPFDAMEEFEPGPSKPVESKREEPPAEPADSQSDSAKMRDSTVEDFPGTDRLDRPDSERELDDPQRTPASMNELLNHSEQFSREIQQTIQPRALSDDQLQSLNEDWGQEASSHTNIQHTIKPQSEDTRPRGTGSSLVVHRRLVMRSHESGADQSDYQIQEAIGEGGIGTVYAAQQSSVTRTVALKVLKPEYASIDEHRQKFIAEAIVIGDLDHPNIVPIYDLAKNDSESLFYTMKRVFGTPWTDVIDTNSQGENIEILEKVCDAIAFAHSRGVIHRDLKPDNIMLGDFGEVLVMDWGIALVKPESPKYTTLRESGEGLGGTPAYMAPEMATGPIESITNKSDVYLLGALLYRFLTKHAPHRGRNVRDCVEQAARNIIQPTSRNDELVEIALRAMSTRPEDRYQDVAAFKEALKKYKSHSESILLSDKAAEDLALARKSSDYQIFSRAVFGFDESLLLWNENKNAIAGRIKAREDYALAAYEKEDFDLGLSLLDESEPHYAKLRTKLISAIEDRNTRASQLQRAKVMFRGVLAFSAAAIVLFALKVWVDAENLETANQGLKTAIGEATTAKETAEGLRDDAVKREGILKIAQAETKRSLSEAIISQQQSDIAKQKADIAVQKTSYEVYMGEIALAAEKIESNAFDEARQILKRYELSELKGWEWYRLWYLTTQQSLTDAQTNQRLETVAVSHHGKWIAAGGDGGEIVIWSTDKLLRNDMGPIVHTIALPEAAAVLCLEFSPHTGFENQLAIGDSLGNVLLIDDVSTGNPTAENLTKLVAGDQPITFGHRDSVLSVRFTEPQSEKSPHPDERWLISSSKDGTAVVWDLKNRHVVGRIAEHSWWVWDAVASPQLDRIITAGQDGKITIWEVPWEEIALNRDNPSAETKPWGTFSVQGLAPEVAARRKKVVVGLHEGPIYSLDYGADSQVASGGFDGRVLVWNPDQLQPISWKELFEGETPRPQKTVAECTGHTAPVHCVRFSPSVGSLADQAHLLLLSASDDNTLRRWDTKTGRLESTYREHGGFVRSCAFAPAELRKIVSVGYDRSCRIWDSPGYAETRVMGAEILSHRRDPVLDAVYDREGKLVASVSADRTLRVQKFHEVGGRPIEGADQLVADSLLAEGHDYLASTVVGFHHNNTQFLTAGLDGQAYLWDINSGVSTRQFDSVGNSGVLKLSRDDAYILTGGLGNNAQLWNLNAEQNDPARLTQLTGHKNRITAVAFSPDRKWILTADADGLCAIRPWDDPNSTHWLVDQASSRAHSEQITEVLFLDETTFATSSFDNNVKFWTLSANSEGRLGEVVLHEKVIRPKPSVGEARAPVVGMTLSGDKLLTVSVYAVPKDPTVVVNRTYRPVSLVWVIDWRTGEVRQHAEYQEGRIIAANFWQGDRRVLLVDDRNRIVDWNLEEPISSASQVKLSEKTPSTVWSAVPLADANRKEEAPRLLTVGGRSARLWDAPDPGSESRQLLMEFGPHSSIETVSISHTPIRQLIATGDHSGQVKIWDAGNQQILQRLKTSHTDQIIATRFASSASAVPVEKDFLLTAGGTNLMIWHQTADDADWTPLLDLPIELGQLAGKMTFADFSPDLKSVLTCHADGRAFLWDFEQLKTGKAEPTFAFEPQASIQAAAFSSDGKLIVLGGEDGDTKGHVWWNVEADAWIKVGRVSGHPTAITCLAISDDGTRLLSGSEDKTIKLWDLSAVNFEQKRDASNGNLLLQIEKIRDSLADLGALLADPNETQRLQAIIESDGFGKLFKPHRLLAHLETERTTESFAEALNSLRGTDEGVSQQNNHGMSQLKDILLELLAEKSSSASATRNDTAQNSDKNELSEQDISDAESSALSSMEYQRSDLNDLERDLLRLNLLLDEPLVEEILTLKGHARAVTSVAFAPTVEIDEPHNNLKKKIHPEVLSSSADGTVIRWPALKLDRVTKSGPEINVAKPDEAPSGPSLR